jgi:hypothetical protein
VKVASARPRADLKRTPRALLATGALAALVVGCATSSPSPSATSPPSPSASAVHIDAEAIASAWIDFARARDEQSFADVPFATDVALALGGEIRLLRPADDLLDPAAWVIHPGPEGFRERTGPFSALDVVADAGGVRTSTGRHGSCTAAEEPLPPPPELSTLQVISTQPDRRDVAACMQWWAVDLFVTDGGRIIGVDLDLGSP